MIPEIGAVISAYVMLRSISFLTRKNDRAEHWTVRMIAVVCVLIAAATIADLLLRGTPNIPALPGRP